MKNIEKKIIIIGVSIIVLITLLAILWSRGRTVEQITGVSLSDVAYVKDKYGEKSDAKSTIKYLFDNNQKKFKKYTLIDYYKYQKSIQDLGGAETIIYYFYNSKDELLFTYINESPEIYIKKGKIKKTGNLKSFLFYTYKEVKVFDLSDY